MSGSFPSRPLSFESLKIPFTDPDLFGRGEDGEPANVFWKDAIRCNIIMLHSYLFYQGIRDKSGQSPFSGLDFALSH